MSRSFRLAWVFTCLALALAACGGGDGSSSSAAGSPPEPHAPPGTMGSGSPISDQAYVALKDAPPGLDLKVSNGKVGPQAYDHARLPPVTKLGDPDVASLLSRAKPIQAQTDDQKAFALRPASQPPPRTGTTITAQFPPPPSSAPPAGPPKSGDSGKDLRVLRWMPEGKVPIAPELSVTFSQPMVAVTSQGDAAGTVPVKLTPQPPGKWRWLGTRTILFDPTVRFPQATTYTVEVAAGTAATSGAALGVPKKFTFETPPPSVIQSYPYEGIPQRLDVPMFVMFDQKIDPAAVLAKIRVTANGAAQKLELLDTAAIAKSKDKQIAQLVDGATKSDQNGRWLAFHATADLPKDALVRIDIPAGTPSAEGPNKTTTAQSFQFRTYRALSIVRAQCGYDNHCVPGQEFVVEFNNPLDVDKFEESSLKFSPDIENVHVMPGGQALMVQGATKARTTYKVTIGKQITDEFGQTLGKDELRTFTVGDAYPSFFGPNGVVVLDPLAGKPTLDFFSTNYEQLKVKLYKVGVADFDTYLTYVQNQWNHDKPPKVPGTLMFDQLVKTKPTRNELVETAVDLTPALPKSGLGHVFAIVEPYPWREQYDPPRMLAWVQSTQLAVDAHVDSDQLIAFATELATGKPAGNVALEVKPFAQTARTDDKGLATFALSAGGVKGAHYLVASRGDDVAFVTDGSYGEYGSWTKQSHPPTTAWYVIDDRKMYKPGEEVSLKGWLRTIDNAKNGDVGAMDRTITGINYKVQDAQGNQIAQGTTQATAVGGFHLKFTLPKTPNLGAAWVDFETHGKDLWEGRRDTYRHYIQIQEFRRPEFEVSAQAGQGPFLVGAGGDVTVQAKYYSGGPLPAAPVRWDVTASQTTFTPPNRDDYIFGSWSPWWGGGSFDGDGEDMGFGYRGRYGYGYARYKPPKTWNLDAKTDATGQHVLHMDFLSAKPAMPMTVTATASVTDVNRQTWTQSATQIVHPASTYVGLRTKKPFVEKGQPFDIDVIAVDLDGKAVAGAKVEVKSVRMDYAFEKGKYVQKEVDPQTCAVSAAQAPTPCSFATTKGGTYQVTATVTDAKGRPNQTKLTYWVAGGDVLPQRDVAQEKVQIIPDKKEYAGGNTAELLVQAPFYPAEGVVTWRRSGIVKTERITLTTATKVITVPITDAMVPNLFVQVDLVGAAPRTDDKGDVDPKLPKRPAYAVGSIELPVPPKQRTLNVTIAPSAAKVAPGETAKLALEVKDAAGRPVPNAEAAVIVVDESILALSNYTFPNPIDSFYSRRGADGRDYYERAYVKLAKPDAKRLTTRARVARGSMNNPLANDGDISSGMDSGGIAFGSGAAPAAPAAIEAQTTPSDKRPEPAKPEKAKMDLKTEKKAIGGEDEKNSAGGSAIAIRSNFNPLAAFAPVTTTDASGKATVEVKMPDNLTRYRIVAIVAASDKQFGKGESAITARLPLMVRPSPPRFLNFGDTFKLPVVVQNQTDLPLTVKLAARTTNAMLTDGAGREFTVPANDRVEIQFPASAEMAGTARFQFVGQSGANTDAAEVALPVWTPATTEAFATYGVIDEGAVKQQVALPGKVVTQFGGVEVTTSSTNLQALTDALLYLVHYPFDCAEQRSSRILAIAALRDVLTAFKTADMPSKGAMEASVASDIEHLSQMQNGDGGFAYWDRGHPSDPYLTVYVASALGHAKAKGFTVPAGIIERAKSYLRVIEAYYPRYYDQQIRRTISSYALYTRKQLGDLDIAKAKKLYAEAGGANGLSMEANGWLLGTLAGDAAAATERAAIVRYAMNKVSETAGAANFTTSYADGAYLILASDHRVDAVMLESLIQEQKDLDLIPKLVTGLLAHRKAGRWLNTQENTFALLAMDLYFHTYEKATPDFVARVWLGNDYAGDHAFKGRSTDYFAIPIPMKDVAAHDKQDLTIQKDGAGRLYYRVGMTYAPASLKLEPADYGFVVQRRYESVDDPKDVTLAQDGTWHIKAGARVRVKLTMANENRRYHVALVDPMPAGLEAMNPALAVTGPIPQDPDDQKSRGAYFWWYGPWYDHQNMRDERVEAFAPLLWEGVHTYEYVARATTPGNFVVPPPKAEEMYMPETFGRGGSDRVIVE